MVSLISDFCSQATNAFFRPLYDLIAVGFGNLTVFRGIFLIPRSRLPGVTSYGNTELRLGYVSVVAQLQG